MWKPRAFLLLLLFASCAAQVFYYVLFLSWSLFSKVSWDRLTPCKVSKIFTLKQQLFFCPLKSCVCPPKELAGRGQDGGTRLVLNLVIIISALIKCCRDLWGSLNSWMSNVPLGSLGYFSWPGATTLKGHWLPNGLVWHLPVPYGCCGCVLETSKNISWRYV